MFLTSYQTLRVVPHGTKGTGPGRHETSVFEVPVQEQHEHSFYSSSTNTFITGSLYTYTGVAHHRALQTSRRGWADSKAVHGMECSGGGVLALLEIPLSRGCCLKCTVLPGTGRCAHLHDRMLNKPKNHQQRNRPQVLCPGGIYSW